VEEDRGALERNSPFARHSLEPAPARDSELVLIFGRILSVELLVPSHAIDVMASSLSAGNELPLEALGVGLN